MKRCLLAVIAITLFVLPTAALAQDWAEKAVVNSTKVRGTVYMMTGAGGNIGVSVGDDGILIVDGYNPARERAASVVTLYGAVGGEGGTCLGAVGKHQLVQPQPHIVAYAAGIASQ